MPGGERCVGVRQVGLASNSSRRQPKGCCPSHAGISRPVDSDGQRRGQPARFGERVLTAGICPWRMAASDRQRFDEASFSVASPNGISAMPATYSATCATVQAAMPAIATVPAARLNRPT